VRAALLRAIAFLLLLHFGLFGTYGAVTRASLGAESSSYSTALDFGSTPAIRQEVERPLLLRYLPRCLDVLRDERARARAEPMRSTAAGPHPRVNSLRLRRHIPRLSPSDPAG
jgi:hypothetical protein